MGNGSLSAAFIICCMRSSLLYTSDRSPLLAICGGMNRSTATQRRLYLLLFLLFATVATLLNLIVTKAWTSTTAMDVCTIRQQSTSDIVVVLSVTEVTEYTELLSYEIAKKLKYDVYVVIDKQLPSNANVEFYQTSNSRITYVRMNADYLVKRGWHSMMCMSCRAWAWSHEKAMYLMLDPDHSHIMLQYKYLWWLEYDVLVPNVYILANMSNTAMNNGYQFSYSQAATKKQSKRWVWWKHYKKSILQRVPDEQLQVYHGLTCAMGFAPAAYVPAYWRFVQDFMVPYSNYTLNNTNGIYNEISLITAAHHYNLTVSNPAELHSIVYRRNWTLSQIAEEAYANRLYLYHPMKNTSHNVMIMRQLESVFTAGMTVRMNHTTVICGDLNGHSN